MYEHRAVLAGYLRSVGAQALLTPEREGELAREARTGCASARDELVVRNLGFVVRVAAAYRRSGIPFEDLIHEGNLGLLEAARRFDPSRGSRFITFAGWWIRKSILRLVAEQGTLVRLPEHQRRVLGRSPLPDEVVREAGESQRSIERARRLEPLVISLDAQEQFVLVRRYGLDGERPAWKRGQVLHSDIGRDGVSSCIPASTPLRGSEMLKCEV